VLVQTLLGGLEDLASVRGNGRLVNHVSAFQAGGGGPDMDMGTVSSAITTESRHPCSTGGEGLQNIWMHACKAQVGGTPDLQKLY
jgi:hypothetical protein